MKTKLMLVLVMAALLCGCGEKKYVKSEEAWLRHVKAAAYSTAYSRHDADKPDASQAAVVDYHFNKQELYDVTREAIAAGVEQERVWLEEQRGGAEARKEWPENQKALARPRGERE